jgi:ethanolamine permease
MASLLKLRKSEPGLLRPYKTPFYPVFPIVALVCGVLCLVTMIYFNFKLFLVFLILFALAYAYFLLTKAKRAAALELPQDVSAESL